MYQIPFKEFAVGMLVFARMASLIAVMPLFGYRALPLQTKAGFSLLLTIIVFPMVVSIAPPVSLKPLEFFIIICREVITGLIIGYATTLLFFGIQMAGQVVGIQIGFGIINVIDPHTESQVSIIGQLNYLVALLIFLSIDGHHFLLRALFLSYEKIPLAGAVFPAGLAEQLSFFTGAIFDIALRVMAPVMVALFITDIALGFMARVAPQMNVFLVGFPLKIGVGLLVITLVISFFPYIFGKLFTQFQQDIVGLIRMMGI